MQWVHGLYYLVLTKLSLKKNGQVSLKDIYKKSYGILEDKNSKH